MIPIQRVLLKRIDWTTYAGMTGSAAPNSSGGGAKHVPFGKNQKKAKRFFAQPAPWKPELRTPGRTGSWVVEFNDNWRDGEWYAARQDSERFPGWDEQAGFPAIDEPDHDLLKQQVNALTPHYLYLVLDIEGGVWAGILTPERAQATPQAIQDALPSGNATVAFAAFTEGVPLSGTATKILAAMRKRPCVLLQGPPGTGKTRAIQEVRAFFEHPAGQAPLCIDPHDAERPFVAAPGASSGWHDRPTRSWWVTFHQGTTYEDFVLGLRPEPEGGGLKLVPRAGPLVEAMQHARDGRSVVFVDEINRGNVPSILGDFITFMEWDKRLDDDGQPHPIDTIPLTFPALDRDPSNPKQSVPVRRELGATPLTLPFYVPRELYLIATMNSLDRSVAPLDTALARRFRRVEVPPDLDALRKRLGAQASAEHAKLAAKLLARVNRHLQADLGDDFQLGPAYFWNAFDTEHGEHGVALAGAWDEEVFPQLRELYRNRPEELGSLLHATSGKPGWPYAYRDNGLDHRSLSVRSPLARLEPDLRSQVLEALAADPSPDALDEEDAEA